MADYGVARLENPDFPHCEKGLLKSEFDLFIQFAKRVVKKFK